jgi:hypothetical protein
MQEADLGKEWHRFRPFSAEWLAGTRPASTGLSDRKLRQTQPKTGEVGREGQQAVLADSSGAVIMCRETVP